MRVFTVHLRTAVRAEFTSFALPFSAFAAYFFSMIDYTPIVPIVFCCIFSSFPLSMPNRFEFSNSCDCLRRRMSIPFGCIFQFLTLEHIPIWIDVVMIACLPVRRFNADNEHSIVH